MKKRNRILVLAALGLGACQTEPDKGDPMNYGSLVGAWATEGDSTSSLVLSQACCGEKAQVLGMFKFKSRSFELEPRSGLVHYSIQKPDSARIVNTFALHLEFQKDGSGALCAVDGVLVDTSGNAEWPNPILTGPAALELAAAEEDSACFISPEKRKWRKVP